MKHTHISVIESKWWKRSNTSIRGIFDLVSDIATDNPSAYHYEMVNTAPAFSESILRIAKDREIRYACIASHGDASAINFELSGQKLSKEEFRELLVSIKDTPGSTLRGIHISSCSFLADNTVQYLFEGDICASWISGYREEVDWIDSSALDLLFFNELLNFEDEETERDAIQRTAERIGKIAGGLCEELGFGIFTRRRGPARGYQNILEQFYPSKNR